MTASIVKPTRFHVFRASVCSMSINLLIITRNNFELHVVLVYFVQAFEECRNQHIFVYASLIRVQLVIMVALLALNAKLLF